MFFALEALFIGAKQEELAKWAVALVKREFAVAEINAWPLWLSGSGFKKGINLFGLTDTINEYGLFLRSSPLWERSAATRFVFLTSGHKIGDVLDFERRRSIEREAENIERRHAEGLTLDEWRERGWMPEQFLKFWRELESPAIEYPAPGKVSRLFSQFKNWSEGVS